MFATLAFHTQLSGLNIYRFILTFVLKVKLYLLAAFLVIFLWCFDRAGRLTDGPYTSYDLNTLLQATAGERRAVLIGQGILPFTLFFFRDLSFLHRHLRNEIKTNSGA